MSALPDGGRPPGPLDRALRLFGDVRAGEGATVLLMCLNVFLLLTAYYVLETAREPLLLLAGGAAGAALGVLLYAKVAENSTDYSVMNTATQMIWQPTSREEKYTVLIAIGVALLVVREHRRLTAPGEGARAAGSAA